MPKAHPTRYRYRTCITSFFPVDETQSYVLRVRQNGAVHQVTLTELPLFDPTVAAYEEHFRFEWAPFRHPPKGCLLVELCCR